MSINFNTSYSGFDRYQSLSLVDVGPAGGTAIANTKSAAQASPAGNVVGGAIAVAQTVQGVDNFVDNVGSMKPTDAALQGATLGATIGSIIPGIGTAIGGVIGAIGGALASVFGRKDPHKEERKAVRNYLGANTALGPQLEFQGFVAPGQTGVISLHGKSHKVDNSSGVLAQATGMSNLLAYAIAGKNERLMSEVSAMFLNAIAGAGNIEEATASLRSLATSMGMTGEKIYGVIAALSQDGTFDAAETKFYVDTLNQLAGAQEQAATGTDA